MKSLEIALFRRYYTYLNFRLLVRLSMSLHLLLAMVCVSLLLRVWYVLPGAHRPTMETLMLPLASLYMWLSMVTELRVRFGSMRRWMTTLCSTSLLRLPVVLLWVCMSLSTVERVCEVILGQLWVWESSVVRLVSVHPKLASYMLMIRESS